MKPCIVCNDIKASYDFYRHPATRDGRADICKACHRERMRIRRLTNPAVQAFDRERYQRPERRLWSAEESRRWRLKHPDAYRALERMVAARTAANLAKVRMEWTRMRFSEWISMDATRRAEMKL